MPFDLWEKIDVQIADRMSVETKITLGVDTHKDTHVAVALDGLGRHLGTLSVPTNTAGYRELLGWARELGIIEQVGVEGTGSFGAGLRVASGPHAHIHGVDGRFASSERIAG